MELAFFKEIQASIERRKGKLLWPYGREDTISERAERVWRILPLEWRLLISKFNPYKGYRDRGLKALNEAGIPYVLISEISGIPLSTIEKALNRKKK